MNGPKDAATSDWKSWPAAKATPTHRWQPNHNTSPNSRTQHENQPPGPRRAHRPRTPRPPLLTHPPTRRATDRLHHSTGLDLGRHSYDGWVPPSAGIPMTGG